MSDSWACPLRIADPDGAQVLISRFASLRAEHRVEGVLVLSLPQTVPVGVSTEESSAWCRVFESLPVSQVDWDGSDGGNSWVVSRHNSPPYCLPGSYCLSPVVVPPVVVPSVAVPSVAVPSATSLLPPAPLVQADGVEARHIDPLSHLQELLRDLVCRDSEEDRPYRDTTVIRLSGRLCLHCCRGEGVGNVWAEVIR